MKHILFFSFMLTLTCCEQQRPQQPLPTSRESAEIPSITEAKKDLEIQQLIRSVLTWANSEKSFDLLPTISDRADSIYIGFDLEIHKKNLGKLRESNLFTSEFIEKYNSIINNLDQRLRTNSFQTGPWLVGTYPPFNFSKDANPWCSCQDVPYDDPIPWEMVEIEELSESKYSWKWGKLENATSNPWNEFRYQFEVKKEDGKWKVSNMEGFKN